MLRLLIILFLFLNWSTRAQTTFSIDSSASHSIQITGSSTLHDWQLQVSQASSTFKVSRIGDTIIIKSFEMIIPIVGFQSEKSKMEKNAKETLMFDRFENIVFKAVEDVYVDNIEKVNTKINGELTIAGKTKYLEVPVELFIKEEILLSSQVDISMHDFGIKPPSLFLGLLTVDPHVNVVFDFTYRLK
jgi:polyisoprenoid-binding protein YceI